MQSLPTNYYFAPPTNQQPTYVAAASQSPPAKRNRKDSSSSSSSEEEEELSNAAAAATIQSKCAKALVAYMQEKKFKLIPAGEMHDFFTQCNDPAITKFLRKGKASIQSVCSSTGSQLKYGKNATIKLALVQQQAPPSNKPSNNNNNNSFMLDEDPAVIAARAARFQALTPSTTPPPPTAVLRPGEIVQGTCTELEKSYLRTSSKAPHPSTIRPEPVLKLAMEHIAEKLDREGKPTTYAWANDQIKAIRQDLKFQHIQNKFALQVYETHARYAIQYGGPDLNELNTCLTQLKEINSELQPEFATYQLLYHVYCVARYKAKSSQIALAQMDLSKFQVGEEQRNAYDIFLALRNRQWTRYLRTLPLCTVLSREMLNPVTEYVRLNALQTVCCCVLKQVPKRNVQQALELDEKEYAAFCAKYHVFAYIGEEDLDVKATLTLVRQALDEGLVWSSLQQHSLT